MKGKKYIKLAFIVIMFGLVIGQCQDNYVINPLYGDGDDDYEECIPSQFVYYVSTLLSGYFFNVVLINEDEVDGSDWVAAFNDLDNDGIGDVCVGAKRWDVSSCGSGVCDLIIYGDDSSELTNNYMSSGDIPLFKIFDSSSGTYFDAFPSENNPWASLQTPVLGMLQSCSGGSLDVDNDNVCDSFDDDLSAEQAYDFKLHQNYPNPFNPMTTIEFDLNKSDYINLTIYDLKGNKVNELIDEYMMSGNHKIIWKGNDYSQNLLPSGNYIMRLSGSESFYYRKMILLK